MCLLNDEGFRAIEGSSRPPLINLTVPSRVVLAPELPSGPAECFYTQPGRFYGNNIHWLPNVAG